MLLSYKVSGFSHVETVPLKLYNTVELQWLEH